MKIRSLHLDQFRKFDQPVMIEGFSDGLNLIAGPNEMGKSTLLLALRAALFERHGSKSQAIKALQPNNIQGSAPSVTVEFERDGGLYRIEKRFLRRPMARLTRPNGQIIEGNEAELALQKILHLEQDGSLPLDKGSPGHFGVMLTPQSQSFYQPSLASGTRHRLEEAITAEIEQLGNQSEVDAVLANVAMAAFEIADKRNKPKGRYKDVEMRLGELQGEIETLERDRLALAEDIDALNDAEEQLRSLEGDGTEDDLRARLAALEAERSDLVRRKEQDAQIAAIRFRLDRLVMTRDQRQKHAAEQTKLATEQERLTREEAVARQQLEESEAELRRQRNNRQSLVEALEEIQEKRRSFEKLNAMLRQRLEIDNALRAVATEVTIDLDDSALDRVRLDGRPIDRATEVVQVVDGLDIDIQDVGRIKVVARTDDLERLGNLRLSLERSISTLVDTLGIERAEPEQIELVWRESEEEAAALAASRADLDVILDDLTQIVEKQRAAVLTLGAKRQQVDERLVVINVDDGDPDQTDDDLAAAITDAETNLAAAQQPLKDEQFAAQPTPSSRSAPVALEGEIERLRGRIEERVRKIGEARVVIGRLGGSIAVRAGRGLDERLEDCYRRRESLERERARFQLDARALGLLKDTLTEAADDAKTQFHAPLAARLTPYIQSLLPDVEPEVTPEFGVAALDRGNPTVERFEQLSDGTREQIAILARLAFAEMLREQGLPALVVLDDALVFSDRQRLARMFDILEKAAKTLQIVILTCREDRFGELKAKHLRIDAPPAVSA